MIIKEFNLLKREKYSKETLNYYSLNPILEGLFCEKIFGPIKDLECLCQKVKNVKKPVLYKKRDIKICKNCNVEITKSNIRNYRMG